MPLSHRYVFVLFRWLCVRVRLFVLLFCTLCSWCASWNRIRLLMLAALTSTSGYWMLAVPWAVRQRALEAHLAYS